MVDERTQAEQQPEQPEQPEQPASSEKRSPIQAIFIKNEPVSPKLRGELRSIPAEAEPPLDDVEDILPIVPAAANVLSEQAPVTLTEPYGGKSEVVVSAATDESLEPITPETVFPEEFKQGSDISAEASTLSGQETIFDDEIMAAFEQLAAFAAAENREAVLDILEPYESFEEDQVILLNQEAVEYPVASAFEAFIMAQPSPEIALNLGMIIAAAPEQSLVETFTQLGLYLAEAPQQPDNSNIEDALYEVIELLPRNSVHSVDGAEDAKVVITPELTQKLFTLLQAVGYPEPQEALLRFVGDHDLAFLEQAIRYLHQLCDNNNRQEFLASGLASFSSTSSEPLAARLGKAIGRLITANLGTPDTAAA